MLGRRLLTKIYQTDQQVAVAWIHCNGSTRSFSSTSKSRKNDSLMDKIYPTPNIKQLPVSVRERMHSIEDTTGFVPNMMLKLARRSDEYTAFFQYYDALMNKDSGNLKKSEKEMIAIVTSAGNKCLYCVIVHCGLHRKYSMDSTLAAQLAANWKLAKLSDREHAILSFSQAVMNNEKMADEHFEGLIKHDLNSDDAWDIASITAFFNMSNRLATFMDVKPNEEYHNM